MPYEPNYYSSEAEAVAGWIFAGAVAVVAFGGFGVLCWIAYRILT